MSACTILNYFWLWNKAKQKANTVENKTCDFELENYWQTEC